MLTTIPARRRLRLRCAVVLPALLVFGACTATPPAPTANLEAARQAIASAERSDATRYAPAELNEARTRIAAADAEVTGKRMVAAAWLADESRAEAELASAKAGAAKARTMNDEMRSSTNTLIEEMNRNSGDKP